MQTINFCFGSTALSFCFKFGQILGLFSLFESFGVIFFWPVGAIFGVEVRLKNIFGTYKCSMSRTRPQTSQVGYRSRVANDLGDQEKSPKGDFRRPILQTKGDLQETFFKRKGDHRLVYTRLRLPNSKNPKYPISKIYLTL